LKLNRGEIYWVNLDPTVGSEIRKKRPCILVGATPVNQARHTVVVIPVSSKGKAHPPLTIPVSALNRKAVAVCDQIRAVDKSRLIEHAKDLSDDEITQVEQGLKRVLGLE
jgi:mRNA interferase MazF